jgi:hypothetical protein
MKKAKRIVALVALLNLFGFGLEIAVSGQGPGQVALAQEVVEPSCYQQLELCWYVANPTTLRLGGRCVGSGNCYGDNGICG